MYNENTGNVLMRETPEYNAALGNALQLKKNESNSNTLREELESYSLEDLRSFFRETVDPDGEIDITELSEEDLIERIMEAVSQIGGSKNTNIAYELSMAKRGQPVSKFARNSVKRALQAEGMNLNMATGKIIRPTSTVGGKRRRKSTRKVARRQVRRTRRKRNRKATRRSRK